ncbi:hypothetical protein [Streptomyces lydicus]|uniref:hypothetical protein n=1 Tax=Streptomyces lydicus TaxID=47763 RepID=UPI0037AD960B
MVPVVISASTSQHASAGSTALTGSSTTGFTSAPAARTDGIREPGGFHGDE